jgi:sugar phosphate isomerase/epimerase
MSVPTALADRLGIFARTFPRETPEAVATEVKQAGFAMAHWNFAALGRPTLANGVDDEAFARVRESFDALGLAIPSVSVTYNVVHPDKELRERQTAAAVELIGRIPSLGADVATLCSGTRDPENMWRNHPDNAKPDAWSDLRATLDVLLDAAATAGIRLGVEPEPGNIVRNASVAARLLAEIGPDAPIGVIFDPANLLSPATIPQQREILSDSVEMLGARIIGAHAKDVVESGYSAAGAGMMDYHLVFKLLTRVAPVPLIAQDVEESDAARVRRDLVRWNEEATAGAAP